MISIRLIEALYLVNQRFRNLQKFSVPKESSNSEQDMELNSVRKVDLPDEIWLKIIQNLPTEDMLGSFALACKSFNNLTQDSMAVKFLQLEKIDNVVMLVNALKIMKRSKGIVELKMKKFIDEYANELICQVMRSSPKLKSLKIKTKELSAGTIRMILQSNIEVLRFEEMKNLDSDGINEFCNIKTLKSLTIYPKYGTGIDHPMFDRILKTLAVNAVPIEEVRLFSGRVCSNNTTVLNTFFQKKKDTLKSIALRLQQFDENVPLKNLNLCQNLEQIVMTRWHSKNLEILSGMSNLKRLALCYMNNEVDCLVSLFERLSLENLKELSIQNCSNVKNELFSKLSKISFPKLESLYIHPPIEHRKEDNILSDKILQELVLNMPNLSLIQFGDRFFKSNLTFKTLMELFEKRKIFMIFSEILSQVLMEKWFLNHDKDLYEKYQHLKFKFYWRLEK